MHHTILVPLDGSSLSECALPMATVVAQGLSAKVLLVRAATQIAPGGDDLVKTESLAVPEAEAYLAEIGGRLSKQGIEVETVATDLEPCDGILLEGGLHWANLIVMCTHDRSGWERWWHGSVAEDVLMRGDIPVLLVRPADVVAQAPLKGSSLLVPLDGSTLAEKVLPAASNLARALDATLLLVRVVAPHVYGQGMIYDEFNEFSAAQQLEKEEQAEADRYLACVSARLAGGEAGLRVQTRVSLGSAADMIIEEAKASDAGLVAMATHGRTGLRALIMGSVARQVFERDSRPLLLVRPK